MRTPDFNTYPDDIIATDVTIVPLGIEVTFSTGEKASFHQMMLREHSPDPGTTHPVTREQQIQLNEFPEHVSISIANVTPDGDLSLTFQPEDLQVEYSAGWLYYWWLQGQQQYEQKFTDRVFWGSSFTSKVQSGELTFNANDIKNDPTTKHNWLLNLDKYGFNLSSNWPNEDMTIEHIAALIGPIRDTNFGRIFDVQTKTDADSNAYTAIGLPSHTDLCTREYLPGIQILHCMANNAPGGETMLVDGYKLAEYLSQHYPEDYKVLCTIPIPAGNKAKNTDYRTALPVFQTKPNGEVTEVRVNPWLRAPMTYDIETVDAIYKALKILFACCELPDLQVKLKLGPGDAIVFDNRRILHGRTAIQLSKNTHRHLRGCYVEREELYSQLLINSRKQLKG